MENRVIGIDLGVTSAHTACVVDGAGGVICKRQARPTLESLSGLDVIPVSVVDQTLERGEAPDGRMGSIRIVGVDPGPEGC